MSKRASLILFLVITLVVVVAAILVTRKPVNDDSWSGVLSFSTSTPSLTLLPDAGWWSDLPTAWAHVPTAWASMPTPAGEQSSTLTPTP
jgi:uncharacterized membrane protein YhaH (DUF805 family)